MNNKLLPLLLLSLSLPPIAELKRESTSVRFNSLVAQANEGSTNAQFNLGIAYQFGRDTSRDLAEAQRWYQEAARQAHNSTQFNLAFLLLREQKDEQAVIWFKQAAQAGHAPSQRSLSRMYFDGRGITQDFMQAMKWYRLAAVQGHGDAQLNLGSAYANGQGVPRDYVIAHMWLQLAAENGLPQAASNQEILAANMAAEDIQRS